MADPSHVEQLLRQLDAQRDAYLDAFSKAHELLAQNLAATAAVPQAPTPVLASLKDGYRSPRPSIAPSADTRTRKPASGFDTLVTSSASRGTGDDTDSDSDDDENFYVQEPLAHQLYEHDSLRDHLRSYKWQESGRVILDGIINDPSRMSQPTLFETKTGKADDRSHYSYLQVYDVGSDGAPLFIEPPETAVKISNALRIWNTIREVNNPSKAHRAVGRISIFQEPSPILFGAIHHTHNQYFDVDELFENLVGTAASTASFHRAFDADPRRQRSFVFNMEYFTIIGKDCQPMAWQQADRGRRDGSYHVSISRCSSVVVLSLGGNHIKKVKNHARRANNAHGFVYDPFAPYQLLTVECFPDWVSTTHVHDSARHYVNGVEAFLVTLLGQFRCAQQRFESINREVSKMITPPSTFMFDLGARDRLQFEDEQYTYSRRYFWAHQTLGIINDSIRSIIDSYEDTLTDEVWEGKHRTLWPLLDETSQRSQYYKKKMATLRSKFELEMKNFRTLVRENDERRTEIRGLREELFTGTSIRESRNSVKNTEVTILQGHNIKLLTLVSMCFLPLTFVTSVFGMTNMPVEHDYWEFGVVTGTVCVPFFILIGSLNTTKGMRFWRSKTSMVFGAIYEFFHWIFTLRGATKTGKFDSEDGNDSDAEEKPQRPRGNSERAVSTDSAMMRLRRWSSNQRAELAMDETGLEKRGNSRVTESVRPVLNRPATSRIAVMWSEESTRDFKEEV